MLSHDQIWGAIDALADRYQMTPSGLAKRAGLDATTFNRSKRVGADGRERWPSTESLAKILAATGANLDEFISLVASIGRQAVRQRTIPLIGFAQAGTGGFFDDNGLPSGNGWDEVAFPDISDERVYALEINGESMMPLYRDGDTIIVSPSAPVRRGDRVVVRTIDGEVMAKELKRKTLKTVELASLNPEHPDRVLPLSEVSFIARVIWASQ
ncbi:MAG: helix-turn-helix transcriptional regulator [Beijerinckiaceae bacterium]|jgi:phage repressor protein C with HTH and peptisase S24 domain|nr:helix-turn-helix transcriptional regulator [Beijerinckiaceae bacterium]